MKRIHIFTDFSVNGPYVGEMKSVLTRHTEEINCIDLMHDAPKFNPRASAYLLAALSQQFSNGDSCLAIVDPGVGSNDRRPVLIIADGVAYCGPDNGLFAAIILRAENVVCYEIATKSESISKTFHGRDVFAPAITNYLNNDLDSFSEITAESLVGKDWSDDIDEIIYFDGFGNAVTGRRGNMIASNRILTLNGIKIRFAETFSAIGINEPFWYTNSMGLVEIALNQGNARKQLSLKIGQIFTAGR